MRAALAIVGVRATPAIVGRVGQVGRVGRVGVRAAPAIVGQVRRVRRVGVRAAPAEMWDEWECEPHGRLWDR